MQDMPEPSPTLMLMPGGPGLSDTPVNLQVWIDQQRCTKVNAVGFGIPSTLFESSGFAVSFESCGQAWNLWEHMPTDRHLHVEPDVAGGYDTCRAGQEMVAHHHCLMLVQPVPVLCMRHVSWPHLLEEPWQHCLWMQH